MAKRFTDTSKYKKPFIRGLKGAYKLFWDYLYHDCDHAGIWIVDFEIAQLYIGKDMQINKPDALKYFNDGEIRIIEINDGSKWFIKPFIEFQYGQLSETNRAHLSVINILNKYNLIKNDKPLTSPLQGCKDMVKDMDKDMDKEKGKEIIPDFDNEFNKFQTLYGKKTYVMEAKSEFANLLPADKEKIFIHIPKFVLNHKQNGKLKYLPRFSEYLRLRRWEEDLPINGDENKTEPTTYIPRQRKKDTTEDEKDRQEWRKRYKAMKDEGIKNKDVEPIGMGSMLKKQLDEMKPKK